MIELWIRAGGVALEGKGRQGRSGGARGNRGRGCAPQSKHSTMTATRCGNHWRRIRHCRRGSALRETNIQHTTSRGISLTSRSLLRRNLTLRLLLCGQDRAAVNEHRLHVTLVVICQNEFRVRGDIE